MQCLQNENETNTLAFASMENDVSATNVEHLCSSPKKDDEDRIKTRDSLLHVKLGQTQIPILDGDTKLRRSQRCIKRTSKTLKKGARIKCCCKNATINKLIATKTRTTACRKTHNPLNKVDVCASRQVRTSKRLQKKNNDHGQLVTAYLKHKYSDSFVDILSVRCGDSANGNDGSDFKTCISGRNIKFEGQVDNTATQHGNILNQQKGKKRKLIDRSVCPHCDKAMTSATQYNNHVYKCKAKQTSTNLKPTIKQCSNCSKEIHFTMKRQYTDHVYKCRNKMRIQERQKKVQRNSDPVSCHGDEKLPDEPPFVCSFCNMEFQEKSKKFYSHRGNCKRKAEGKMHKRKSLDIKISTRRHRSGKLSECYPECQERKKNGQMFECLDCQKLFRHHSVLVTHDKLVHENETSAYACKECKRTFNSKAYLMKHTRAVHEKNSDFHCDICDMHFVTGATLKAHINVKHLRIHRFLCDVCGKNFRHRSSYVAHYVATHGREPSKLRQRVKRSESIVHQCEKCSRCFSSNTALIIHNLTHTNFRPYECNVCAKTFRSPANLNIHMKIHTGEKHWKCEKCGKSFTQQGTLHNHQIRYQACTKALKIKERKVTRVTDNQSSSAKSSIVKVITAATNGNSADTSPPPASGVLCDEQPSHVAISIGDDNEATEYTTVEVLTVNDLKDASEVTQLIVIEMPDVV